MELLLNILTSKYIIQSNGSITEFHQRLPLWCVSCCGLTSTQESSNPNGALDITGSSHNHNSELILGEVAYVKVGGVGETQYKTFLYIMLCNYSAINVLSVLQKNVIIPLSLGAYVPGSIR